MNRKDFLAVAIPAGITLGTLGNLPASAGLQQPFFKVPPYLQPGDTIGITSPAGYISLEEIRPAVIQMESWGMKVRIGNTIGKRHNSFGGTDEERQQDLQQMLDDPSIKAIMCARGGYGMVRIIDQLDFTRFKKTPKWVIGFSDITVFHAHISRFDIPSIHSKMCNSFPEDWSKAEPIQVETILSIKSALMGEQLRYTAPALFFDRTGTASGKLIGGNLRTLENLGGTPSQPDTKGKLLFVEDTGEALYSIDRMFWNLKRCKMLSNLGGLIVGGFKLPKDEEQGSDFGQSLADIVMDKVKDYKYPVCFGFPVGHQRANFALKCGIAHTLTVGSDIVKLESNG